MFWLIVLGVVGVLVALIWWSDRRRRGSRGLRARIETDIAITQGRVAPYVPPNPPDLHGGGF
jgi:hypothetical protein